MRRNTALLQLASLLVFLPLAAVAVAQSRYPEKPVRIVGGAIGGLPDTIARLVGQKLSELWGQPVVNENRISGAGSLLAAEAVAKAAPDGYTLLVTDAQSVLIHPLIIKDLPYSPRDLAPAALVARAPLFLAVHRSLPVNTLGELVALARAQPGKLNYGSSGVGSTHQLSMEYIKLVLGLDIVHVPYKGTATSVPALVAGQVQMVFSAYPSLAPHARAGSVKLLVANSLRRSAFAPDVPTVSEAADLPGYDFAPSIGLFVPAATPREIVNRIAAGAAQAVKNPEVGARLLGLGIDPVGSSTDEYVAQLKSDAERYTRALKAAGVKPE
jgi:tripartite-type tricarboxylate transporter receptor subunit TctC